MFDFFKMGSTIQSLGTELQSLKSTIQKKRQDREKSKESPIPLHDHIAMMEEFVDEKAEQGRKELQLYFSSHSKCYQNSVGTIFYTNGSGVFHGNVNENILCLFLGDLIKEKIRNEVKNWPWHKDSGPTRADRAAVLSKLDNEIADLESKYDDLREKAESAGIAVERLGVNVRSNKH